MVRDKVEKYGFSGCGSYGDIIVDKKASSEGAKSRINRDMI